MTYVYQPYPRAMYLGGEVKPENRIVVESELEEVESRRRGYLKAYEKPMEALVATEAAVDMLKSEPLKQADAEFWAERKAVATKPAVDALREAAQASAKPKKK